MKEHGTIYDTLNEYKKERMDYLINARNWYVNFEATHGIQLSEQGKEWQRQKIAEIDEEWDRLNPKEKV